MMVSVLILTKNEESDLPGCLRSVAWCDDVHVYDSCSTDATVDIARKFGANIVERNFDNWSSHQNWGLKNIKFKYKWVFYIDADERMSSELVDAVRVAVEDPGGFVAFKVRRRDFFENTWLKHVQTSSYYIRLFRPEFITYERLVNPITVVDGLQSVIGGYLDHFPFSKGLSHWIARHNSYSSMEAAQIVNNKINSEKFSITGCFFEKDFHKRRFNQKELFFRMPLRPVVKFLLLYFFRLGFLDGMPGFKYAIMQSIYEYFIVIKVNEIEGK